MYETVGYIHIIYSVIFNALLIYIGANIASVKKLEVNINNVAEKNMAACVCISAYDTVTHQSSNVRFSGVVVTEDGYILTAAHATLPNQIYKVVFPNGSYRLAKGLGRVAVNDIYPKVDIALIKITEKCIVRHVEMGWSDKLKNGEYCIGISYPGTFTQKLPNVRLGILTDVHYSATNMESTCKMEPGDSGGPLFNLAGYLIGIHSWVKASEQQNFEIPVDLYRRYWSYLLIPKTYSTLPDSAEIKSSQNFNGNHTLPVSFSYNLPQKLLKSIVEIHSKSDGRSLFILGTAVKFCYQKVNMNLVISKSSMVADSIKLRIGQQDLTARVICRDKTNDLILLKVDQEISSGITFQLRGEILDSAANQIGRFMISALPEAKTKIGIKSTQYVDLQLKYSIGYFGANASFIGNMITITELPPGGPASKVLQLYDQIEKINNVSVKLPYQYAEELNKYIEGDTISVDIIRNNTKMRFNICLGSYISNRHTADKYLGGKSFRSDGFSKVFIQDAAIEAKDCGGPVFDLKNKFQGINIARHSRTSTVVMPVQVIESLLYNTYQNN